MLGKCITGKLEQVLDMQMTTISDMQVGDLIIEIDFQVSIASFRQTLASLLSIYVAYFGVGIHCKMHTYCIMIRSLTYEMAPPNLLVNTV
jgi:hypothetical protein